MKIFLIILMYCFTFHSAFANDSQKQALIYLEKIGLVKGLNDSIFVSYGTGANFSEAFCESNSNLAEFINVEVNELDLTKNIDESSSSINIGSDYKITSKHLISKSDNYSSTIKIEYLKNYLICNFDYYDDDTYTVKISYKGDITKMLNYLKDKKGTRFVYFNSYKKDLSLSDYQVTILQIIYLKKL